ncbi:hypothetical protein PGIGA_G00069280 [Pangasianodon gigas]|uniref:Uncharacterized protein n=1 Tax=Pangasianodon gigas TaxID=30993 RepID=A0ACC5X8Z3_PANGG|nr:hypothetical protein [Pangasianodon gigas]
MLELPPAKKVIKDLKETVPHRSSTSLKLFISVTASASCSASRHCSPKPNGPPLPNPKHNLPPGKSLLAPLSRANPDRTPALNTGHCA